MEELVLLAVAQEATLLPGPWISFYDYGFTNIAQPDALLLKDDWVFLVEVKLSWVPHARTKMQDFYQPLLERLYPNKKFKRILIYKNSHKAAHKKPLLLKEILNVGNRDYAECQWF